ncbi:unannotated protein [freshwater metagenome]|uniref:Unannotated protein n=1 Tax=freshwater metagenome TaxID=449393 RepID=A0A6J7FHZ1_9ZZZZ|nr:hypothetical protein [Actinomycetota bacterium]
MSIDRGPIAERLPFLLEIADELGLPHRVVPWVTRTGAGDVVSATVRLQVHAGAEDPQEDGSGEGWVEATNSHDLRAAAGRRSRAPIDVLPAGTSASTPATVGPGVYRGRRTVPAARILLQADLNEPDLRGAVEIREVEERRSPDPRTSIWVDELVVDCPGSSTRSGGPPTRSCWRRSPGHCWTASPSTCAAPPACPGTTPPGWPKR